jgi:hypothetical protein
MAPTLPRKIPNPIRSVSTMATKSLRLVACCLLLLTLHFVNCYAQADPAPKRFVIWDEHGKFGYMDETGRVVIKPQFDTAYPFAEGLAAVSIGNKAGFIDESGNRVIPFQYHFTSSFSDGIAAVTVRNGQQKGFLCGYINHANKFIIEPQAKFSCKAFHEGFADVEIYDDQVGESLGAYINKKGQLAVAGGLAVNNPFSEGLALVEDFSKWFFVNKDGQTVIDLRSADRYNPLADSYEPTSSFSEGLAMVGIEVAGRYGYSRYAFMNRRGRMVFRLPQHVTAAGDFHDGRAQVYVALSKKVRVNLDGETWVDDEDVSARGYIDATGKIVIAPRFSRVKDFSEGLAVVRVGKGLPIDDYNITPERWQSEYADNEAKYYSCIDRSGRVVIERCGEPLSRDEIAEHFQEFGRAFGAGFVDGLFFSKTELRVAGKMKTVYGYMNRAGKYVWIQPPGTKIVPGKG